MYLDPDELRRLNQARLVNLIRDPASGLTLADYAARAQFDNAWDAHPVLLDCRGTLIDTTGHVVAKPFRKFFNLGERPETQPYVVAAFGEPEVTHKLDGSMGTLFYSVAERRYRIATRGSFVSAQALHATQVWTERYAEARVDPRLTYVFEIIYPGNRIVVDYRDRDDPVLIGLVQTETGRELPYTDLCGEARRLALPLVDIEPSDEWSTLHARERTNFEGFVLFWPDRPQRIKVKLGEYLRLHRALFGINEHALWEALSQGQDLTELRSLVSEEIRAWIDDVAADLLARFGAVSADVDDLLAALRASRLDPRDRAQRGELAAMVRRIAPPHLPPIVFRALDGKDYAGLIWKQLEPSGAGRAPAIDFEG